MAVKSIERVVIPAMTESVVGSLKSTIDGQVAMVERDGTAWVKIERSWEGINTGKVSDIVRTDSPFTKDLIRIYDGPTRLPYWLRKVNYSSAGVVDGRSGFGRLKGDRRR